MRVKADRQTITLSVLATLIVACAVLWTVYSSAKKSHAGLVSRRAELLELKQDYLALKGSVDAVEGRKTLTNVQGIVQAVDEVFKSLGLTDKVKSVKPTVVKQEEYGTEEEAEIQVEKVSMNEMANIFYKIENAPMILTVRRTTVKTSFDDPTLLNISMTVALVKPK
jgi:general secretion pathway protein M